MNDSSVLFRFDTQYDLAIDREFSLGFRECQKIPILFRGLLSVLLPIYLCLAYFTSGLDALTWIILIVTVSTLFVTVHPYLSQKRPSLYYKRMLLTNHGQGVHQVHSFTKDTIVCEVPEKSSQDTFSYSLLRYVIETRNLLLLVMDHRLCLILDKRTVTGGSTQEFLDFLFSACPHITPKKVRTGKPGRISSIIMACVCVLVLIVGLFHLTAQPGSATFSDASEKLTQLGFLEADPKLLQMLDDYDQDFEYDQKYRYLSLLSYMGMGEYDDNTWEWTPGNNHVYWFNMEFLNIDTMYTDFLRGISALNPDTLDFTNIQEDHSRVDWEQGTGVITVSFDWKGQTHSFEATVKYDWFDLSALDSVNGIVSQSSDRQLYFASDGGQGCLVFYGDEAWEKNFEKTTGIRLVSHTGSLMFY